MKLTLAVQAGGESRRMGQDKGLAPLLGQPLVSRVIERLERISDEVLVTTNNPKAYRFLRIPLFPDLIPGIGALSGLYTALSAAQHPLVAVVACDMPFASADLLAYARQRLLEEQADLAIPFTQEGYEPFHTVYRRETCLPAVKGAIDAGERRMISWFKEVKLAVLKPEEVAVYDPQGLAFWNVNTPDELRQAEEIAKQISQ
jgi:molybdopterin-guanine dinucleotide biosynthesis protein A